MARMSTGYEQDGRIAQKQRTLDALIDGARRLMAEGVVPTIEATAEAAQVSRTTAYRYFNSQRDLVAAAHPLTEVTSLLPDDPPSDPAERLSIVVDRYLEALVDEMAQQRTTLRLSLDPEITADAIPLRQGRAIRWLTEALAPVRSQLDQPELERLVRAIRTATGIEALIWLTDVAGLTVEEALEQMRWSAAALYRGAMQRSAPPHDADS